MAFSKPCVVVIWHTLQLRLKIQQLCYGQLLLLKEHKEVLLYRKMLQDSLDLLKRAKSLRDTLKIHKNLQAFSSPKFSPHQMRVDMLQS